MSSTRLSTGVWLFPDSTAAATIEAVQAAEDAGLDELWLGDEGPGRDPFAILAVAARLTSRIRLGIAVTNPYVRHPASTAATAMTVQEISGGRFTLGLGAGGGLALDPLGIARTRPTERVREAIRITRAVANGVPTDGYTAPAHAVPAGQLPVVIGARGERLNRLASHVADGVFLGGIPTSALGDAIGWATSVRPIEIVLSVAAAFDEAAFERLRPQLAWTLFDAPASTRTHVGVDGAAVDDAIAAFQRGDDGPARRVIDDRVAAELSVRGSSADIAAQLAPIVAEHAPHSIVLNLHACGDPVRAVLAAGAALAALPDLQVAG